MQVNEGRCTPVPHLSLAHILKTSTPHSTFTIFKGL
ncbi:hypothetical protein E2C01_082134 [Portunus trituberculatus]|uniref:Uncharacterized protein n=1 Tax=Portunus trituberculatus TaxID=210409 RepID=A0A5B7IZZ6_PORTR|nr:hypothetical protein [Portunus trituberculatus]